ncbi:MAG: amidohydrolase family protein [Chloroflexi bacterium]|nr:amidohydrolase family protein [Chloroflexota bacterium]
MSDDRFPIVISGGTVVTMNPAREVVRAEVVAGGDGSIQALLPPGSPLPAGAREIDATGRVVIPGLVQAHLHLCQTLFRGLAEERTLLRWLRERIWPLEAAHDPASLRASARLGIVELLLSGTTAILDMGTVHHTEQLFLAAEASGIRYTGGQALMDAGWSTPAGLLQPTDVALAESDALRARWDGAAGGRLRYAYAPRFVLSCSEPLLRAVAERARAGARVHTHASEQQEELRAVQAELGMTDLAFFAQIGLLGPNLVLAHGVWLDEEGLAELAQSGTHVTHCPASNLKLGSGIAPLRELRRRGVNVALGADGAACSNRLDAWSQLWLAGLVASVRDGPGALHAPALFELATLGGARALGLEDRIGSIEPGKRADLVLVDLSRHAPNGDVYTTLVYSARPDDVRTVIVDGSVLVDDGHLLTLDEAAVRAEAVAERETLLGRADIESAATAGTP